MEKGVEMVFVWSCEDVKADSVTPFRQGATEAMQMTSESGCLS